jgi:hypothetical protein
MLLRRRAVGEEARRLDRDVDAELRPRQLGGVARMTPSPASTGKSSVPRTESCFRRCAIVFVSPMSFTATSSKSPPRSRCARKKFRPIRPKPLIPTLIIDP